MKNSLIIYNHRKMSVIILIILLLNVFMVSMSTIVGRQSTEVILPHTRYNYIMPGMQWDWVENNPREIDCEHLSETGNPYFSTAYTDDVGAVHVYMNGIDYFYCVSYLRDNNFYMVAVYGTTNIVLRTTFFVNRVSNFSLGDFWLSDYYVQLYQHRTCLDLYQTNTMYATVWSIGIGRRSRINPTQNQIRLLCNPMVNVNRIVYELD